MSKVPAPTKRLRRIVLEPARAVDGADGYFVEVECIGIGAVWLPKGAGARTYLAQAYLGDGGSRRMETFGEAFGHVLASLGRSEA